MVSAAPKLRKNHFSLTGLSDSPFRATANALVVEGARWLQQSPVLLHLQARVGRSQSPTYIHTGLEYDLIEKKPDSLIMTMVILVSRCEEFDTKLPATNSTDLEKAREYIDGLHVSKKFKNVISLNLKRQKRASQFPCSKLGAFIK